MNTYQKLVTGGMSVVCSSLVQKVLNRVFGINPEHFTLGFIRESNSRWYADIKHWPKRFHANLEMVAGADDLLEALDNGNGYVKVEVSVEPSDKRDWFKMIKVSQTYLGATYTVLYCDRYKGKAWLCNVGKFVMGKHPDCLFVRQIA